MLAVPARSKLNLSYIASAAPTRLEPYAILRSIRTDKISIDRAPALFAADITADRSRQLAQSVGELTSEAMEIVGAGIGGVSGLLRGQFYIELEYRLSGGVFIELCRGYHYNGFTPELGDRIESVSNRGFIVTNEGATTLVNDTAVTRTIACPTNTRWKWKGGTYVNADNVTRNVTVRLTDGTNEIVRVKNTEPCETLIRQVYPSSSDSVALERFLSLGNMAFDLRETFDIEITWATGGASAGGTARSSALVEEWLAA